MKVFLSVSGSFSLQSGYEIQIRQYRSCRVARDPFLRPVCGRPSDYLRLQSALNLCSALLCRSAFERVDFGSIFQLTASNHRQSAATLPNYGFLQQQDRQSLPGLLNCLALPTLLKRGAIL